MARTSHRKPKEQHPQRRRPERHLYPSLGLLCKLGSIVIHADEITEEGAIPAMPKGLAFPAAHEVDVGALRMLLDDQEVQLWITEMGPMLPRKRSTDRAESRS